MMHAAMGGHVETCTILLAANAEVNANDEDGMCPLHFAAKSGNATVFDVLMMARGDPTCQDTLGRIAVNYWNPANSTVADQSYDYSGVLSKRAAQTVKPLEVMTPCKRTVTNSRGMLQEGVDEGECVIAQLTSLTTPVYNDSGFHQQGAF